MNNDSRGAGSVYALRQPLAAPEWAAIGEVTRRVRREIDADLVRAVLFGSRARGEARPDSDLDLLLIFRALPPDREPQAGQAEQIADAVALRTGVPVATWSVSLPDLRQGVRTPMLVDALDDGVPLWPVASKPWPIQFTRQDAHFCADALLERVAEGGEEVRCALREHPGIAAARARDDLVRLCTAALLLHGVTRPRHADAVRAFATRIAPGWGDPEQRAVLRWAAASLGPDGTDEDGPVRFPPGGAGPVIATVEALRRQVAHAVCRLDRSLRTMPEPAAQSSVRGSDP